MEIVEEKGSADGRDDYTQDGSVDLKGRPVLRSKTGRWKACSFIVVFEMFERMAFGGIASNLVVYLTDRLHQVTVKSSNNVNNWVGTLGMTPILGAYIADAFLGRYWTFIVGIAFYIPGMALLTLSVSVPALRPPSCSDRIKNCDHLKASPSQVGIFFCALYMIALGIGGTKPTISTIGADQFDDFDSKERLQKLSFFNWWMFTIFFGALFANTFMVYIQDNVSWGIGYGILTISLLVSVLVFLVGTPFYRHKPPLGSPITRILQVLVAAVRKWNVVVPSDPKELCQLTSEEFSKPRNLRIEHTPSLSTDRRSNISVDCLSSNPGGTKTKQMLKMIPIMIATFIPSTMFAQVVTLFVKQATTLERSIGPNFKIPPASLLAFVTIFMLITIVIYDRCFVPVARKFTKNPRGITLLKRMGTGFVLHIIIMLIAFLVERKRLRVAREHGLFGKNDTIPLTVFVLLPQFALMGIADNFAEVAKLEFFYDQAPEGMKSLGTACYLSSLGIGFFLGSLILSTASDVSKKHGHKGWILDNLNISHLDNYYAFLAVLGFLNFLFFLLMAKFFVYNKEVTETKSDSHEASPDKDSFVAKLN